jgi:hypothetical protein
LEIWVGLVSFDSSIVSFESAVVSFDPLIASRHTRTTSSIASFHLTGKSPHGTHPPFHPIEEKQYQTKAHELKNTII